MASTHTSVTKVPPYSVHSEKVLLASMLRHPGIVKDVKKIIASSDDFFRPENARLYEVIIQASRKRRSLSAEDLITAMAAQHVVSDPGEESRLRELADDAQDAPTAVEHAKVVAEKARMRQLIDAISDTLHDAYYNSDGYSAILGRGG